MRWRHAFGGLALLAGCRCDAAPSQRTTMPPELANEATLAALGDWRALPTMRDGTYRMQSSEDRRTGQTPQQSLWSHDNRDMNNFVCRGKDSDVPDSRVPFVFDEPECAEPYVRGAVLARFEGSGRLARLWLTAASIRNAPADDEVFRIYVDDALVVEAPLAAVLDGSAGEMFAPPFGAGSTRRMAWYYPVVFGRKLIVSLDRLADDDLYFHQTAVVLEPSTPAATRRAPQRDAARTLLASDVALSASAQRFDARLASGAALSRLIAGPATLHKLRFRLSKADAALLRNVDLSINWDGATEPAIALSLGALFLVDGPLGHTTSPAMDIGARGDDLELSLQLPMPFRREARLALHNRGEPIDMQLVLEIERALPRAPFGQLHAEHHVSVASDGARHPLSRATGRGRLVGVCMALHGHGLVERGERGHPMHFLEGDELGMVDNERAIAGTGTEDYFNGAFYFEEGPSATPFAQTWAIAARVPGAPSEAKASACRWHVLGDAIDYRASLLLDMEVGPGRPEVRDRYESVAFSYRLAD